MSYCSCIRVFYFGSHRGAAARYAGRRNITVHIAAISESKNEQINRNAYFAKEEERIALLERYKKLYAEGIISEAEFASKKNSILREMGKN